jgi:hypothetical protein
MAEQKIPLTQMVDGTDGNLFTYDANGNPVAVATGTSGQVLTSNGAGAAPTFQAGQAGSIVQTTHTQVLAVRLGASSSAVLDDSIPQLSECPVNVDFDTAFTPTNASNIILVEAGVWVSHTAGYGVLCLFTDAETGATAATADYNSAANVIHQLSLVYKESAGSTTARTYKLGFGNSAAGNIGWNGAVAGTRVFGGVGVSSLRISEIQV